MPVFLCLTNHQFHEVTRVNERNASHLCIHFCIDSDIADAATVYPVSGLLKYLSLKTSSIMLVQNSWQLFNSHDLLLI